MEDAGGNSDEVTRATLTLSDLELVHVRMAILSDIV